MADFDKTISQDYGLLLEGGMALRGTFLIDKDGVVQHSTINNLGLGRNIDEMIRLVDALQHLEEYGEVCPANWEKGKEAMKPTAEGVASYLKQERLVRARRDARARLHRGGPFLLRGDDGRLAGTTEGEFHGPCPDRRRRLRRPRPGRACWSAPATG